jgi:hypothetical protein
MPDAPLSSAKACSVCGVDVSSKPRTKDAKGRYVCQECYAKAHQTRAAQTTPPPAKPAATTKPAAEAPPQGDNSFLLGLGSKNAVAESGTKPCPECGRALNADAIICVGCGYSFERGKRLQVKVTKAKAVDEGGKPVKAQGGSALSNPWAIAGLVVLGFAGLAGLSAVQPSLGPIVLLLAIIYGTVINIWGLIAAWQDDFVAGLLYFFLPFYNLYWILLRCPTPLLRALWVAIIPASIAGGVAMLLAAGGA